MSAQSIDYDGLMQANLKRVFGERDATRRLKAIAELYADDAVLYEPPDASASGHAAINQAVQALMSSLPPNFVFTAIGPAVGHHDLGRLRWQSGPPNGPVAVTGTDVRASLARTQSTAVASAQLLQYGLLLFRRQILKDVELIRGRRGRLSNRQRQREKRAGNEQDREKEADEDLVCPAHDLLARYCLLSHRHA